MRGLGGFVLLAGIGVGLFVYFPAPVDYDTSLERAKSALEARLAVRETRRPQASVAPFTSRVASFSPGQVLATPEQKMRVAAAPAIIATPPATPAARVEAIASWPTQVVAATASGPLAPTDPESRYRLVVDIQQQLKRVGCYWGRVNGSWNNNTREAMRSFTTTTNAALPVEKPDYLLLSLLKSHNGRSCGAPETTTAAAAPAQPEVLPWKAGNAAQPATRLYTPLPNSVVSTDPLPGRMAIGGPRELQPAAQAPLIPGSTPGQPAGVGTAALEPGVTPQGTYAPPAPSKPRQAKKSRRPGPGTPRYNLMMSLGGVY
jgi:hypothetical protein